jgi:CO/xanthine dehydrogenase FAD-binding subunit
MTIQVQTVDTAQDAARLVNNDRSARVLGGGTLVMAKVNAGDPRIGRLIRLRGSEQRAITVSGNQVTLGAGVTMADILAHRDLAFLHPAAQVVGGPAVRNMATVGGNLFARAPYGDMATLLLALGAEVTLAATGAGTGAGGTVGRSGFSGGGLSGSTAFTAGSGTRPVGVETLWQRRSSSGHTGSGSSSSGSSGSGHSGYGAVVIETIHVPRPTGQVLFHKMSRMQPRGPAIVTVAAHLDMSAGRVRAARIALGGVQTRPCLSTGAARILQGARLDGDVVERAVSEAMNGISAITDSLATDWYRGQMVQVQLRRLLASPQHLG